MPESDLTNRLEQLRKPTVQSPELRRHLKLTLVDARTSSRIGAVLVGFPAVFLFGIIAHYGFGLPIPGLAAVESLMLSLDRSASILRVVSPLVLAGAPILALALNLLAILHVDFDRGQRELIVAVKLRIANLMIIALSAAILAMLVLHIVSERAHHLR